MTGGPFAATSRYFGLPRRTYTTEDGRTIAYVGRRFLPAPETLAMVSEYAVREGDRLDNLAANLLGDPEQYWRICDANAAMRPDDLTAQPGHTLRITLPEGVPGPK